jgi:hypothetical protein
MTMAFITLSDSIKTLLGSVAAGQYRVIGYQSRSQGAEEVVDSNRLVQVYYSTGDLPKSSGSLSSPAIHDITFTIEITVSKAAEGDLATIDDALSTPVQLQAAIAGIKTAEDGANDSWNEVADLIWNTLMDARNSQLGLSAGTVGSRWVPSIQKKEPVKQGDLVVISGFLNLNARVEEVALGETPTPIAQIDMDVDLNNSGDLLAGTRNTDFTP